MRLGVHRVVEILGVFAIDRDQRQSAQVDAFRGFGRVHFAAIGLRFADRLGRKLLGQIEARDRRFAGQLHRLLGIETFEDPRLRRSRTRPGITGDGRDDPVAMARAAELVGRHEAAHADAPVGGGHEGGAAVNLERRDERLGGVLDDFFQPPGIAAVAAALDRDADAVAVHHAGHLRRRQEHGFFLALDAHEAEAGAVRAHDAFGDSCGGPEDRVRAMRRVDVMGVRGLLHGGRACHFVVSKYADSTHIPANCGGFIGRLPRAVSCSDRQRAARFAENARSTGSVAMNKRHKSCVFAVCALASAARAADLTLYSRWRFPGSPAQRRHRPAATGKHEFQRSRLVGGHRKGRLGAVHGRGFHRQLRDARARPIWLAAASWDSTTPSLRCAAAMRRARAIFSDAPVTTTPKLTVPTAIRRLRLPSHPARVAELVDALVSGTSE